MNETLLYASPVLFAENGGRLGRKPYISSRLRDALKQSQDKKREDDSLTVAPVSKRGIFSSIISKLHIKHYLKAYNPI